MSDPSVRVARIQAGSKLAGDAMGVIKLAMANPMLTGLAALALNQAAYKAGLWSPRASPDGKYRTWRYHTGIKIWPPSFDLLNKTWDVVDPEEIAAGNANTIGILIMVATVANSIRPISVATGGA